MNRVIFFIYDDTINLPINIKNIVGEISFGEIINKKEKIKNKIKKLVSKTDIKSFYILKNEQDKILLLNNLKRLENDFQVIHFYANGVVVDNDKFINLVNKIKFSQGNIVNKKNNPYFLSFTNIKDYESFLASQVSDIIIDNINNDFQLIDTSDYIIDISELGIFLSFFSGGFDARFFNQLYGDDYTLIKKSTDIEKIRKEYSYYHLIPDELKSWFVMPYNLRLENDFATYTMERLNIPDVALQWIHNSMNSREFKIFLNKIFNYLSLRPKNNIDKHTYLERFYKLYYQKVIDRVENLKKLEEYSTIDIFIRNGAKFGLDELLNKYKILFDKLYNKIYEYEEVIGHGDLCFSNILYDKSTYTMKFIDTKGALEEKDLWTDPFYDIAKLSHSILGRYDFINNGMFDICLTNSCMLELTIKSYSTNNHLQETFIDKLRDNGFDIRLVRLCESSLFLSMLPLHIDNPRKVIAFILNAINIIEELESNV